MKSKLTILNECKTNSTVTLPCPVHNYQTDPDQVINTLLNFPSQCMRRSQK